MANIFSSSPRCGTKVFSVGDCLDKLKAFNAVYEANKDTASVNSCGDDTKGTQWRKLVREGVINCGGEPMELDFFEAIAGGKTETIDAKSLYIRYNCDIDQNVYAQAATQAATAGQPATFQLLKALHSGNGKYSYPAEGYSIYIYEDRQWVYVTGKNVTTDYGHLVTVEPYDKSYQVKIRTNSKMLILPVRLVNGLSCPKPTTSMQTPGYTSKVQPFRIRKDWCVPIDLMRGYEDVLQFAIMFDENGKEVDCWELYEKTTARREMKWAKNLLFFMGQKVSNPTLLGNQLSADYSGFDGYLPTLQYGGGTVIDIDPSVGFDLEADFGAIILKNDALKRTNEFVALHAKPFMMGLIRNANEAFKHNAGSCTFETFKRMGQGDIQKLGIDSYKYLGYTIHFKELSALSDSRGIGNYDFPHMAMLIPGNGLRDSKGREVPAIEFYQPKGCAESGMFEEHNRDMRKINGCETLEGHVAETVMMAVHCPNQHIFINPVMPCS